ncbi:D-amino-acid dehydrogenase [Burkholderia sp. GAS332]|nr:D-amino-acid dehydrogenase [Burkholderia sp. GAS332]
MKQSVTVIGAGLVGLCTALYLQNLGFDVTVVDPGDKKRAASFGNAGQFASSEIVPLAVPDILYKLPGWMLNPQGPLTLRPSYLPIALPWLLRLLSASRLENVLCITQARSELCVAMEADYKPLLDIASASDLVSETHHLRLYESQDKWDKDSVEWSLRRQHGLTFRELGRVDIAALDPGVSERYKFAICSPSRRFVRNPGQLMDRFLNQLVRNGAEIVRASVTGFDLGPSQVRGLRLSTGKLLPTEKVVIAAGAWSHRLTKMLGDRVPLETERGYHIMVPGAETLLRGIAIDASKGIAIVPMDEGLRITGSVEFAGLDAPPDPRQANRLLDAAAGVLPELAGYRKNALPLWLGHRPTLPDSLPIIDRARSFGNTYYAFGHNHMGLSWAGTTARLISELITEVPPSLDLSPFRTSRFFT